jgi:predicted anti-sigma-YlaC factor YlaD
VLILAMVLAAGCSIQKIATRGVANALTKGPDVYSTENDPELVREAVPFGLKTLESLLASLPEHEGLLLATCSGFTQYAVGFVAADAAAVPPDDFDRAQALRERALRLCLRARDYGLRGLELKHAGLGGRLLAEPEKAAAEIGRAELPMLYWTAAAWGSAIGLGKDRPELLADVTTIRALMGRGLALDETYQSGSFHEAMIVLESLPEVMGGSRSRAQKHFDRAVELSNGGRASTFVSWAENVAVPAQDRALFDSMLDRALALDPDREPAQRLVTILMQRRARALQARADDLFLAPADAPEGTDTPETP